MNPEIPKFLFDILESISTIESYLESVKDLHTYKNDKKTIDAIERRLAIIGEALNKANKHDESLQISNKNKIIGLRHILVHDYDLVDDDTIWAICKKYLPILRIEIKQILES